METFIVDGSSQVFQAEDEAHAIEQFLDSIGVLYNVFPEDVSKFVNSVINSGYITVWQSQGEEW
jgi:hypothetical protein